MIISCFYKDFNSFFINFFLFESLLLFFNFDIDSGYRKNILKYWIIKYDKNKKEKKQKYQH